MTDTAKYTITLSGEDAVEVAKILGIPEPTDILRQNVFIRAEWVRMGLKDRYLQIEFEGD